MLLYDGDCGFCRWSVGLLLAADRRRALRPVALQDPEADRLLAGLSEEERMASAHLLSPEGRRWSGGEAAAPALRLVAGGRPVAAAIERFPAVTERAYRWVADHRGLFGRPLPERWKATADRRIAARR